MKTSGKYSQNLFDTDDEDFSKKSDSETSNHEEKCKSFYKSL